MTQTDPFRIDPDYHGSLSRRLSRPELGLPREQRVKVLRAERGWRERVQRASTPRGDLSPPFFETGSALLKRCQWRLALSPRSWNFYKLSVREQEEKDRVEICKSSLQLLYSLSSTRLRFQRSDSCSLFFKFGSLWTTNSSRKRTEMTRKDCAGRERIQSICEMKSLWRHTGSCLGYCLRKDSNECLWHGHIRKLKHWALSGLARWIILFISRWWSTGNLVSGFVLFPEIDRSFALVFHLRAPWHILLLEGVLW